MSTNIRLVLLVVLLFSFSQSNAEITPEVATIATLPSPNPHWVWVTDISYPNFVPGTAHLLDTDNGKFLGMITMGYGLSPLGLPKHGREIYTVETHYDRTVRGNRHDMVGVYSAKTLELLQEIPIPPKKLSAVPMLSFIGLTDDDQYMLIYNFTPSQSVSIVDVKNKRFVAEIETAGCGLTLPAGNRRFLMLCGNGALRDITFTDAGEISRNTVVEKLFDHRKEFLTEKAVRIGNTWLFVSNKGDIQPVKINADSVTVSPRWPLFSANELQENWKIGGQQHLAVHAATNTLYAAVHQGPIDSHKDPGSHVFVYDLDAQAKTSEIAMERPANSIQISQDQNPILITTNAYPAIIDIYDVKTGKLLREVGEAAISPMTLQTPFNR